MKNYDSIFKSNPPVNYEYNEKIYIDDGYKIRARVNKTNPESEILINELKSKNLTVRIHDLVERKNMIDVWVK